MNMDTSADLERLFDVALSTSIERKSFDSVAAWFNDFNQQTRSFSRSIDRAILGGKMSLNLGFAFASAYQSAIESLFKPSSILLSSFCVTEEKGNHPRAIETRLYEKSGQLFVEGSKRFVSGANDAQCLYVACIDLRNGDGIDDNGRPIIKMVSIQADNKGVDIQAMPALGFIPELSHGKVSLNDVAIHEQQIFPEDGYLDYVKAFRSVEDLHVLAAIVAYRLGEAVAGQWPQDVLEAHVSLILALRALSDMDLRKPAAHIALAACRSQLSALILKTDSLLEVSNPEAYQCWCRDKVLLNIAEKAHIKRTQAAWGAIQWQSLTYRK